jgi:hypothetical protein
MKMQMQREAMAFEQQMAREKAAFEQQLAMEQAMFTAQLERDRTAADVEGQRTKADAEIEIKRKAAESGGSSGKSKSNGSASVVIGTNGEAVKMIDGIDAIAEAAQAMSKSSEALTKAIVELAKPKDIVVKRSGDKIVGARVQ